MDVDPATLIPILKRLGPNLERIFGPELAAKALKEFVARGPDWREGIEEPDFYLETAGACGSPPERAGLRNSPADHSVSSLTTSRPSTATAPALARLASPECDLTPRSTRGRPMEPRKLTIGPVPESMGSPLVTLSAHLMLRARCHCWIRCSHKASSTDSRL